MGSWTPRGAGSDRRRLLAGTAAVVLAAGIGLGTWAWSDGGGGARKPSSHTAAPRTDFLVSYSAASSRLAGLNSSDSADQVRDWLRTALAAHFGMNTAAIRDADYDTLPVRDQGFTDLADQQVGPGRELADTSGVLHLLVPQGDPHENRTVGLMLDQYRTDHGADPELVQIHHYSLDQTTQTADIVADQISTPDQVRTDHGYVSTQISGLGDLTAFLGKTRSLSELSVRDGQVWADGWSWPDVPSVPVTVDDVSVLQQGYQEHLAGTGVDPGFSLDPLVPTTTGDVKAMAPSVSSDIAARLLSGKWTGSPFHSSADVKNEVENELYSPSPDQDARMARLGLPTDRTQLWALEELLSGQTSMSQARYDGGLAGTAVGDTLAYVDYVTKNWVAGVGQGVPTRAVGGFLADPSAVTPWSECAGPNDPTLEHGRLWFGRNDGAFTAADDHIDLGAEAARLFVRDDGPNGTEVEPSYAFGRALQWWDVHQQDIEDYEPQYQRLDQIMRWSGALEWLTHQGKALLPVETQRPAPSTFKDWYAAHTELRERAPIAFVTPPSAKQEALIVNPSRDFQDCGFLTIEGGVSLSDVYDRTGGQDYRPDLPTSVTRAGLFDPKSAYDVASGTGTISRLSIDDAGKVSERIDRTLSMSGDTATVDIKATGRKVIPLGDLKVWRSSDPDRVLSYTLNASRHSVHETLTYQGHDFGALDTADTGDTGNIVVVRWRSGLVDKARRALSSIQAKLTRGVVGSGVPAASDGVLYEMKSADGTVKDRLAGPGQPWLGVTATVPAAADALAFRIGGPDRDKGAASFMDGGFTAGPGPPAGGGGGYLRVQPPSGGNPAVAAFVGAPDRSDPTVTVRMLDGPSGTLSVDGDGVVVPAADPVVGVDGSVEGAALLRDFPKIEQLLKAAGQAKDGKLRGAALGDDGVALAAGDGTVYLAPLDSDIADAVLRALGPDLAGTAVFDAVKQRGGIPDEVEEVDAGPLTEAGGAPVTMFLGSVLQTRGAAGIYFSPSLRAALHLADGPIIPEALPPTFKVSVVPVSAGHDARSQSPTTQADVRVYEGEQWRLADTAGLTQGGGPSGCPAWGGGVPAGPGASSASASSSPTPGSAPSAPSAPVSAPAGSAVAPGTILMVSTAGKGQPVC